jgi:hypothetical protein
MKRFHFGFLMAFYFVLVAQPAATFELSPIPTKSEIFRAKRNYGVSFRAKYPLVEFGIHLFSTPVHEALTQLGYDCDESIDACSDVNLDFANSGVIAGVRWNDDPPFQFGKGQGRYRGCPTPKEKAITISFALRTDCWYAHFKDVASLAERNPDRFRTGTGTLLARTHFGDLQFLHGMARVVGESPQETKAAIMMWAEFTWRVQTGSSDFIRGSTRTGSVPVEGFQVFFPTNERRTVAELFTVGRPWLRHQLGDVAFGSLLHLVQDSFAGGHTKRQPATTGGCSSTEIVEFHTYPGQEKTAHIRADSIDSAKKKLALLESIRTLIEFRNDKKSWDEVKPFLDNCVFPLAADARPSTTTVDD